MSLAKLNQKLLSLTVSHISKNVWKRNNASTLDHFCMKIRSQRRVPLNFPPTLAFAIVEPSATYLPFPLASQAIISYDRGCCRTATRWLYSNE
jgi:hypothetical protein